MPANSETQGGAPRVLVIEDDLAQREYVHRILAHVGFQCDAAGSFAEGIAVFQPGRYACALVDLGLPDGDGTDLIRRFGDEDPCVVQIVLTGDASVDTIITTMRVGAFDYLTKPVDSTTLRAAVNRAVAHHAVVTERSELFRLLYEEREQLRERVDTATNDIRQYAAACETSNARLRALLHLSQVSAAYYSEEALIRRVFEEIRNHLPLRLIILHDTLNGRVLALGENDIEEETQQIRRGDGGPTGIFWRRMDPVEIDPVQMEADPEGMVRSWARRNTDLDPSTLEVMTFQQQFWNQPSSIVAFFFDTSSRPTALDKEFLDMCAYLLAFEWERGKLLFHVAHQASLGNIAVEMARNFIQPLTAIRTAADVLNETADSPEITEGLDVIQESVERLRRQIQEFRKLSTLRNDCIETVSLEGYLDQALDMLGIAIQNRGVQVVKDIQTPGDCILLNGTALARTFLDLLLAAVRAVDVGGKIWVTLRPAGKDHAALEIRHSGPQHGRYADPSQSLTVSSTTAGQAELGLQLAERTIHSCGGNLVMEVDSKNRTTVRILLPRNATRFGPARGTAQ